MKKNTSFSNTAIAKSVTYNRALTEGIPAELSLSFDQARELLDALKEEGILFDEPAKQENNIFSISAGRLVLTDTCCIFTLHELLSVPGRTVIIPLCAVERFEPGDNFMLRGAVHIILKQSAHNRARYTFLLDDNRNNFITRARQLLLRQNNPHDTSAAEGLQVGKSQIGEIGNDFVGGF